MLENRNASSSPHFTATDHHLRPAGVTTNFNETALGCMTWEERPCTPPEIRKYRQSTVHEPGRILRHPGVVGDEVPIGPFGAKTESLVGENVGEVLKTYPQTDLGRWLSDRKEVAYASTQDEPLGRSRLRGHKIPEHLGTIRAFGILSGAKEKEEACYARQITFPNRDPEEGETAEIHELHVRSHGAYAPGEQRKRGYDWKSTPIDPEVHTFGAVCKEDYRDGVRKALNPEDPSTTGNPKIVDKRVEDVRSVNVDILGQPKNVKHGERPFPKDVTFGMPTVKFAEDGVDKLISGNYCESEQMQDPDLGKSLREGWRNLAPDDKVFGVPTIRLDITAPSAKSVASIKNYGNEPGVNQLIHPTSAAVQGVNEQHYLQARTRDELWELVNASGLEIDEDQFQTIFQQSSQIDGKRDHCCINTFMRTRVENLRKAAAV